MGKQKIQETIDEELLNIAKTMCKEYCKYGKQFEIDQEKYDADNPTYHKHCVKCPIIDFY